MAQTDNLQATDKAPEEAHIDLEFPKGMFETGSAIRLAPKHRHTAFNKKVLQNTKLDKVGLGGAIYLPVPPALSEVITNEWESALNADNLLEVMVAQIGVKLTDVLGAFGRRAQISSGISNVNADIVQLYKGTNPREFTFSWSLLPQSEQEAMELRKIIRVLKFYSSPSITDGHKINQFIPDVINKMSMSYSERKKRRESEGNETQGSKGGATAKTENINLSFLSYPATWDIDIIYHSPSGGKVKLFQILNSVSTNLNIVYSDGESFNFYRDGNPIKVSIEATFRETRLFTTDVMNTDSLF